MASNPPHGLDTHADPRRTTGDGPAPDLRIDRGDHRSAAERAVTLVVAWGTLVGIAMIGGRWLGDSTALDRSISEWFVSQRTGVWNSVTRLASLAGDTYVVIGVASVAVIAGIIFHRRGEVVVLVVAMIGEVTMFLTITAVVSRERPDVERLDGAPPTSSFPSGHTFAAIVLWGALAVVVTRSRWSPWLRSVFLTMMVVMPLAIGASRIYRGMHHLTDVLASVILGTLWLVIVVKTLPPHRREPAPADPAPTDGARLELGESELPRPVPL